MREAGSFATGGADMREELRPAILSDFGVTKTQPLAPAKASTNDPANPPVSCRIYIQRMVAPSRMAGGPLFADLTDSTRSREMDRRLREADGWSRCESVVLDRTRGRGRLACRRFAVRIS